MLYNIIDLLNKIFWIGKPYTMGKWIICETINPKHPQRKIFKGCFNMSYSANSVVQDNRKGGMKHDYVILFEKKGDTANSWEEITKLPGWSVDFPKL